MDLQKTFDEVAREALELSDDLYSNSEEEIIARLDQEVEIIHPDEAAIDQLRERTRSVYDFFVERGDFTWDDINAAIEAARSCEPVQTEE